MQFGGFSHGKCFKCKYFSKLKNFKRELIDVVKNDGAEFFQLLIICPKCGDKNCEALFPNEVN